MSCYGGPIPTPNIDRIADSGVRFTQWHTTALCSPTRSCLLTGRNHTRNSMACITEAACGFPNGSGTIPPENGMVSEILGERGWNTYIVGKWHLCPTDEMNLASTRRNWPTGRGFERFYGFLGAETNQWYPELVYDNHPVEQPSSPEEGYHLTEDLTDKALEFIRDAKAIAPDKPFFLYYAPGACHAPHHAPREWIDRFRGQFDMGYEAVRADAGPAEEMGLVPEDTKLPPVNPIGTPGDRTGPDGMPFPAVDYTKPWDTLGGDERRLFARMAEVYAGFLAHADHHIGRLLDFLEESGQRDNTLVILVSDNGASGEGGPDGSVNENLLFNGIPDDLQRNLSMIDELGGPRTYNHYCTGWAMAFNTPFKMWKRYEFNGGTSDPCIIAWPSVLGHGGEVRHQYHHAIDIVPTILDCLGVDSPAAIKGQDNRLHYVNNFVGIMEQKVVATEDVPTRGEPDPVGLLRQGRGGPAGRGHRRAGPLPTGTARSARAVSRSSRATSSWPARACASAGTAAPPSPTTIRGPGRTGSPAAPSTGSPSTSAANPTSTSNARRPPCSPGNNPRCCREPGPPRRCGPRSVRRGGRRRRSWPGTGR